VDDFGALNSALPDPEPIPAEAVSGAALEPPPETTEGAPDAPAVAATRAEDPATVAVEATAEATAEAPATAGSSQVA
jgi:hypothetical protein